MSHLGDVVNDNPFSPVSRLSSFEQSDRALFDVAIPSMIAGSVLMQLYYGLEAVTGLRIPNVVKPMDEKTAMSVTIALLFCGIVHLAAHVILRYGSKIEEVDQVTSLPELPAPPAQPYNGETRRRRLSRSARCWS